MFCITLTLDLSHDLDLGFLRSNVKIAVFQEWMDPNLFETFQISIKKMVVKLKNDDMGWLKKIYIP